MRGQGTHIEYKDVSWASLKKLLPYLSHYRYRLIVALAFLVAAKLASIYLPFVLKHIVDALDADANMQTRLVVPLSLLLAYGAIRLANVLFSELRDTVFGRVTERAMHHIALKVFDHLHSLDLAFHLDRKTGALGRDIERGTTGISFLLRFMVFNIVPTLLEILLVIVILSSKYTLWFGAIVLGAIVSYVAWSVWATERRTRFVREMNTADNDTNSRAVDSLLNYETVKYFGNEGHESKLYDQNLGAWETARRKNRLSIFALNGGQAAIISVFMTAAMILAAYRVEAGLMTIGDFVLINAFMMQIFMPLNFLGFVYREMKGSMANIEKMFSLLEVEPQIRDAEQAQDLVIENGHIEFRYIRFSYSNKREIFRDLNINFPANATTAIVGSSGSGKSTISKLLFRFYDVDTGEICIDNQNIKHLTLNSLRSSIGFVPQDAVLFNASIFDNVRYGDIHADEARIRKAISMAHLDKLVAKLPDGENTLVGERGLKLSGGEKQRIAIARAILKNPKILVFDEATSSLDSESESEILQAIEEVRAGKTSIVIAHRLSTIKNADNIIVLENGALVEQGTHSQLLSNRGRYSQLWELQESQRIGAE